jgi:acyl-CoA thioester hydrolase
MNSTESKMTDPQLLTQHEIEIRVRYQETDGQGRLHHANYINFFEVGRVELLRASGHSYRQLEQEGVLLVVAEASCRYFAPADYDDLLRLRTTTVRAKGARIEHRYELFRGDQLLAQGRTVVACVDREGRVRRLPAWLCGPHRTRRR